MKSKPNLKTVTFSVKGQMVIPSRLRRRYGIKAGTKAAVLPSEDGILIKPITGQFIKSLRGSLKGTGVMEYFMTERRREREL